MSCHHRVVGNTYHMAYCSLKRSGKNHCLVPGWKSNINRIPTIVNEVRVSTEENLAEILGNGPDLCGGLSSWQVGLLTIGEG